MQKYLLPIITVTVFLISCGKNPETVLIDYLKASEPVEIKKTVLDPNTVDKFFPSGKTGMDSKRVDFYKKSSTFTLSTEEKNIKTGDEFVVTRKFNRTQTETKYLFQKTDKGYKLNLEKSLGSSKDEVTEFIFQNHGIPTVLKVTVKIDVRDVIVVNYNEYSYSLDFYVPLNSKLGMFFKNLAKGGNQETYYQVTLNCVSKKGDRETTFEIIDAKSDWFTLSSPGPDDIESSRSNGSAGGYSETSKSTKSAKWESWLKDYESFVDDYVKIMKKTQSGDMSAMNDLQKYMEKATKLGEEATELQVDLSSKDLTKFMESYSRITQKLTQAQ